MINGIHSALNRELIKRLLVRYFKQKGFSENFNKPIYPPQIQDITLQVPQLAPKLEITPYVIDLEPTGEAKLGWNLFVLGTQRMFLGESRHTNLSEIQASIAGPLSSTRHSITDATPKRIINFITAILSKSKNGDISTTPQATAMRMPLPMGTGEHSGYFRQSQRPVF